MKSRVPNSPAFRSWGLVIFGVLSLSLVAWFMLAEDRSGSDDVLSMVMDDRFKKYHVGHNQGLVGSGNEIPKVGLMPLIRPYCSSLTK